MSDISEIVDNYKNKYYRTDSVLQEKCIDTLRTTLGDDILDDIYNLPTRRWALAGDFVSYMLEYLTSFDEIDIFIFDDVVLSPQKWYRAFAYYYYYSEFDVYHHRNGKGAIEIIIVKDRFKDSIKDCMYNLLDHFDHIICKKAMHMNSALVLDINFGTITFSTAERTEKYMERIKKMVHEPLPLLLQSANILGKSLL